MLSIAGTGAGTATEFFGKFRHLCRVESKCRQRPKTISVCSCMAGNKFSHRNCIWRVPGTKNFNFKSRDSYLIEAIGKEVRENVFSPFSPPLVVFISFCFGFAYFGSKVIRLVDNVLGCGLRELYSAQLC